MPRVLDCLRALGDSATSSEAIDWIGKTFRVSEEERARVNKYKVRHFDNKVAWAKQYLTWEGLLDSSRRGVWALTPTGKATFLTPEASLGIYRKWAAIHRERKTKKDDQQPSGHMHRQHLDRRAEIFPIDHGADRPAGDHGWDCQKHQWHPHNPR